MSLSVKSGRMSVSKLVNLLIVPPCTVCARETSSSSINPCRIDDEIGKAAVAIVHAGEHLVDFRQRRYAMFENGKVERPGLGHGRHFFALAGGEPHRAFEADPIGHH